MRKLALLAIAAMTILPITLPAIGQNDPNKPKNEVSKLDKARKTDNTTRQVTPDPKKSPGKHAKNLSRNINHEANRTSKHVNHLFRGKKKHHHHSD